MNVSIASLPTRMNEYKIFLKRHFRKNFLAWEYPGCYAFLSQLLLLFTLAFDNYLNEYSN